MGFVLPGVGSLGDVLPQIALAGELTGRGHRAVVVGLRPYAGIARSLGVEYVSIPSDTTALWPADALRRRLALAQPGSMFASMLQRLGRSARLTNDVLVETTAPDDIIVSGIVTAGAARLLSAETGARTATVLFAPLLPASSAASSALAPARGGRAAALVGSSVMWRLSQFLASAHTTDMARRLHTRAVAPLGSQPVLMATSPVLNPASHRWPSQVRQMGWIRPPAPIDPEPMGSPLRDFLAGGHPPVLMTFGTCPVVSAHRDIELFLGAAAANGARTVLQTDALPPGPVSDTVFNAPGIHHGVLMPQVSAVVHHGGAGTTYASLAAGRPAMVVPHLGDQGYYARRTHALGAGPCGVPRWRLSTATLTERLRSIIHGQSAAGFRHGAARVASALAREDGRGRTADALEALLGA